MAALGESGTSSAPQNRVSPTWVSKGYGWGTLSIDAAYQGWFGVRAEGKDVDSFQPRLCLPPGLFASVSKISKAVDVPPSSVTSTPRTPRMDFSRVTGKGRREHKGQRGSQHGLERPNWE